MIDDQNKTTMKALKHISVAILFLFISVLMAYYLETNSLIMISFQILIIVFFSFNFFARKSISYKKYFVSPYNPFTGKIWSEKAYDIPKELLFEKIIEVINDSNFNLVDLDKDRFEILAISKTTFESWGENLYISFESKGDDTIMKFCSSTFFGIYSWGKNEKNWDNLLNEIESSLTV